MKKMISRRNFLKVAGASAAALGLAACGGSSSSTAASTASSTAASAAPAAAGKVYPAVKGRIAVIYSCIVYTDFFILF